MSAGFIGNACATHVNEWANGQLGPLTVIQGEKMDNIYKLFEAEAEESTWTQPW